MNTDMNKIIGAVLAAAVLTIGCFSACKNSSDETGVASDLSAIIDGASDDDGSKTASLLNGEMKAGDDGTLYLFDGLAGAGKFEVKSAADWNANISSSVLSLEAAGSDKMVKIDLDMSGALKQYEMTYGFGSAQNISGTVFTAKVYIPAVYSEAGSAAYPVIQFYAKTGTGWTGRKFAELNTLNIGSGWKTIAVDFVNKTFTVDSVVKTAGTGEIISFADADLAALTSANGVTIGFYGAGLPTAMTGAFYLDYLDVSGFSNPILSAPVISCDANNVTITAAAGASVYYTVDGSAPTAASTPYAAFSITADTTVKAIAVQSGYDNSPVASQLCVFSAATDLTVDPAGTTFSFASNIDAGYDDLSDFGISGSRFAWAKETVAGSDGVLVVKGVSTAPTSALKSVFTMALAAPIASPTSITIKIRVPAGMANDWFQSFKITGRLGAGWTESYTADIKFPDSGQSMGAFTADTWKTIVLTAAQFTNGAGGLADLRAITFDMYRDFVADTSKATSINDIEIDYISVQ